MSSSRAKAGKLTPKTKHFASLNSVLLFCNSAHYMSRCLLDFFTQFLVIEPQGNSIEMVITLTTVIAVNSKMSVSEIWYFIVVSTKTASMRLDLASGVHFQTTHHSQYHPVLGDYCLNRAYKVSPDLVVAALPNLSLFFWYPPPTRFTIIMLYISIFLLFCPTFILPPLTYYPFFLICSALYCTYK